LLKKRLHTALSIFLCCFCGSGLRAQVTFNLTESIITNRTDQSQLNVPSGRFSGFQLTGSWEIWVKANTSTIPMTTGTAGTSLPLNVARLKLNRIASLSLGAAKPEITLSTVDQSIAQAVLLAGAGDMFLDYRLVVAGTAWQAGTYSTTMSFIPCDPFNRHYTVVVDPYITKTTSVATTATLTVASLADFRTNGISTTQTLAYNTSVPTDISLRVGPGAISFNANSFPNLGTPTLVPSALSSALTGTYAGSQINLTTSDQALSTSSGIPVQINNLSGTFTNTLKVTPANLKANFVQAGNYVYPLQYTISKTTAAQPAILTAQTMATTATIVVPRLFEAIIPSTGVNLSFTAPSHYTSGVTVVAPAPIAISSTIPYNVTVRASSDFTLGAGTIPASVLTIEGASGQTGVNSVALTTTAQTLISSSAPIIDRAVNLQYRIPNTQTSNLLNKTAGQYAADVIFTVTAP
jgi:hypothetical protein